jgi:hypothetical protein
VCFSAERYIEDHLRGQLRKLIRKHRKIEVDGFSWKILSVSEDVGTPYPGTASALSE